MEGPQRQDQGLPGRRSTTGYDQISSVEQGTGGKFDVVFKFAKPFTDWKSLFSPLYPAAYNSDPNKFNKGYLNAIPVTAGPFGNPQFDKSAKTITVTPNPDWWGNKPLLDKIVFRAEAATALNQAYINGEIDYDFDVTVDPTDYKQVKSASNGHVTLAAGPDYRQFTFNGSRGFLKDEKVRQAMWLGTDRTAIIKSDLTGIPWPDVPLNNHFFMNSQAGYQDNMGDLGTYRLGQGRADAHLRRVLEGQRRLPGQGRQDARGAVRHPGRLPVEQERGRAVPGDDEDDRRQGRHQDGAERRPVRQVHHPRATTTSRRSRGWARRSRSRAASSIYKSPKAGGGQNFTGLSNPQVDQLLAKAVASPDSQEATSLTQQADKLLYQEGHTFTLFQRPQMCGVKNGLANLGSFGFASVDYTKIGYEK